VYIIVRKGDLAKPDWSDELWRYDSAGQGTLLYSIQGLNFRVAPDESFIAVNAPSEPTDAKVAFIDANGKVIHQATLNPADGNPYGADSGQWSADSKSYWDILQILAGSVAVIRIDVADWQMASYPITHLKLGRERELNPNTGLLVYSDFPIFFDADSAQNFAASGKTVTLSIYDLKNQKVQAIATSTAKEFKPKWLSDNSIEYNDPKGTGRIVYKLP
jgi:hypothetical protein